MLHGIEWSPAAIVGIKALLSSNFLLDVESPSQDMQRKQPDTQSKPFFGAGGSMLRQFDEHHAGLTRTNSLDSATATPPRSVVGIGGKGAQTWSCSK